MCWDLEHKINKTCEQNNTHTRTHTHTHSFSPLYISMHRLGRCHQSLCSRTKFRRFEFGQQQTKAPQI